MKLKIAAAICGASMLVPLAFAGTTQPAPVIVDLDANFAQGDMLTARDAKSDDVFIGCGTRSFDDGFGGTFEFGFCQAQDEEVERGFCNTTNPGLTEAMGRLDGTSFVTFSWDPNTGECTRVGSSTQSFYLDKHSKGNQKGNER